MFPITFRCLRGEILFFRRKAPKRKKSKVFLKNAFQLCWNGVYYHQAEAKQKKKLKYWRSII